MNTLFIRLEGPLQSWGLRSRWGERDTAGEPTKSGVIGLLGAALGLRRGDPRLRELSDGLRMGVRVDKPGRLLRDYHTTGGGSYGGERHTGGTRFHDQPYAGGVLSAEIDRRGRIKVKVNATTGEPETDVSERFYLADASFLVALQGAPVLIEQLAAALRRPVWLPFLGRKSCPPSTPLLIGTGQHDDLEAALRAQPLHPDKQSDKQPRMLIEVRPGEGRRQNDNIGTPRARTFLPRYVAERPWQEPPALNTMEG